MPLHYFAFLKRSILHKNILLIIKKMFIENWQLQGNSIYLLRQKQSQLLVLL